MQFIQTFIIVSQRNYLLSKLLRVFHAIQGTRNEHDSRAFVLLFRDPNKEKKAESNAARNGCIFFDGITVVFQQLPEPFLPQRQMGSLIAHSRAKTARFVSVTNPAMGLAPIERRTCAANYFPRELMAPVRVHGTNGLYADFPDKMLQLRKRR